MIVVFDLFGDFGHFKVPYTTTSPLTFPFPPKTAIYGILSAILGLDKNSYLNHFQNKVFKVGISTRNPVKKITIAENFINTKVAKMFARMSSTKSSRTQIRVEFLKDPRFRIYCTSNNTEMLLQLNELLKEHKTQYTISLGLSECLANISYVGLHEEQKMSKPSDFILLNSVLPLEFLEENTDLKISLNSDRKYLKIHMPVEMKEDRELIESAYFLIESSGSTIEVKPKEYYRLEDLKENIILF